MIDFTNGNNSNRYDPNVYIKTKSGCILAFMKILESIAALIGLAVLFISSVGISAALNNFFLELNEALSNYLPASLIRPVFLSRFPFLITAFFLVLIILDGIGIFMMRFGSRGEGLVRFVHIIYWILSILGIIIFIVSIILSLLWITDLNKTTGDSTAIFFVGVFLYLQLAIYFAILLFWCGYHHDVSVVLKTVHEEKRSIQPSLVGSNHLMGRSGWLAWGSGIAFVYSALLLIYPLVTHKQIVPETTWDSLPNLAPVVLLSINCTFCLLVFMKYLSLRICVRNFYKRHEIRGRKSSVLLVIILLILLCVVVYAIGKNDGMNVFRKHNPTEIIEATGSGFTFASPTAEPNLFRNSLPTHTATPVPTRISTNSGGVDPDLKEFLNGYEAFMDKYVAFMKNYSANPSDINLLLQYTSMLAELEQYSEAADRWSAKESEMSAADLAYYTSTMLRINNKLMTAY